jgi:hypothetical protein
MTAILRNRRILNAVADVPAPDPQDPIASNRLHAGRPAQWLTMR